MLNRTQEDRNAICSNFSNPFVVTDIVTPNEIQELIELFNNRTNKIHKNTGPITSDLNDIESIPVLASIVDRIKEHIGECEIYRAFYFYVNSPHIIHNDDDIEGPITYKGITIPLEVTYFNKDTGYPSLCFFEQYYLEGPSKFFGGSTINIPTWHNVQVYEYSKVQNKSDKSFDLISYNKYLTHLKRHWLQELSFDTALEWKPGSALIFDSVRLHCASDFVKQGIKSKLGISIFTKLSK